MVTFGVFWVKKKVLKLIFINLCRYMYLPENLKQLNWTVHVPFPADTLAPGPLVSLLLCLCLCLPNPQPQSKQTWHPQPSPSSPWSKKQSSSPSLDYTGPGRRLCCPLLVIPQLSWTQATPPPPGWHSFSGAFLISSPVVRYLSLGIVMIGRADDRPGKVSKLNMVEKQIPLL